MSKWRLYGPRYHAIIEACAAHYGDEAKAVKKYLIEGQAKALALPNRGPLTFDSNGNVSKDILNAYSEYGFYILEDVLSDEELKDIKADLADMRENFPVHMGCLLYTSPSPRDKRQSRMPSSA